MTWLLDGTLEPETPVFLGIEEAATGMLLGNWKIPSENATDVAPCLRQTADLFGPPSRVLHDLSPTISGACELALPGVSHFVCHQHLARDVGEDLYEAPQAALVKRLRTLKLQYRPRQQRQGQTEWFRQRLELSRRIDPEGLAEGPRGRGDLGRYARPPGPLGVSLLDSRLPQRRPATRFPFRSVLVVLASPTAAGGRSRGSAAWADLRRGSPLRVTQLPSPAPDLSPGRRDPCRRRLVRTLLFRVYAVAGIVAAFGDRHGLHAATPGTDSGPAASAPAGPGTITIARCSSKPQPPTIRTNRWHGSS